MLRKDAPTSDDALRAAFDEHYRPLFRLCLALGEQRVDAEDLVQEAFLRAAPSLDGVDAHAVRSYLRRTLMNLRVDRHRAHARHRPIASHASVGGEHAVDDRDALWRALGRLPDRQRACLVLRFYEDLPEGEVAKLLGCSVGTVKSQTHRGLARLREEVDR